MVTTSIIPWEKYAIIAEMAQKLQDKGLILGKTGLQKLIYFLQEIYKYDIGYRYSFYTYGPYCSELSSDLNYVKELGGVEIKTVFYPNNRGRGYEITPGDENDYLRKKVNYFSEHEEQINNLINEFGEFTARDLELKSTIFYMHKELQIIDENEIIESIREIKPYFIEREIKSALDNMKAKKFI